MALPETAKTTTMDIYRPFGGALAQENVRIRMLDSQPRGRRFTATALQVQWSHIVECDHSVDIRDGCTRAAGSNDITYADGDEVRIPDASGTRFVVVWVTPVSRGSELAFKRVYLLRHDANWTGSFVTGEGNVVET
jgi:hypothetical protein